VFTIPVFDSLVFVFSIYAACMGFYFSEDVLWLSYPLRKLFQRTGHAFLAGYVFLLPWDLTFGLGSILVPDTLVIPFVIANYLSLFYILRLLTDIVSDNWGRTNRAISRRAGNIYGAFKHQLIAEATKLWKRRRDRLPKRLRRHVIRLGHYAGWRHAFARNIRRAYMGVLLFLVVGFFVIRQIFLSDGATAENALIEALFSLLFAILLTIWFMGLVTREMSLSDAR